MKKTSAPRTESSLRAHECRATPDIQIRRRPATELPTPSGPELIKHGGRRRETSGSSEHSRGGALAFAVWNRPSGTNAGIWDEDGNYTNRNLLSTVDDLLLRAQEDPSARASLDSIIAVAVSRLVEEFLSVRVWNAFPGAGDRSSAATITATGASDGSSDLLLVDEADLVRPAGVSVLGEIAQRVIRAGGAEEFRRAFADAPCEVLDSLLSILPDEPSHVGMERWSAVTKLFEKAIVAMQKQLYAQNSGAFHGFRDEYLMAIAQSRVLALLESAEEFTRDTSSHEKLPYILGMYEALSDASPSLLLVLYGERKVLVSERLQDTLTKLADVAKTMTSGLVAKVVLYDSSDGWSGAPGGVHPLTPGRAGAGAAPHRARPHPRDERVTTFRGLVEELIEALERSLEKISALNAGGHLFLANNINFVLNRAADADLDLSTRRRVGRAAAEQAGAARGELRRDLLGSGRRLPGDVGKAGESAGKVQRCVHGSATAARRAATYLIPRSERRCRKPCPGWSFLLTPRFCASTPTPSFKSRSAIRPTVWTSCCPNCSMEAIRPYSGAALVASTWENGTRPSRTCRRVKIAIEETASSDALYGPPQWGADNDAQKNSANIISLVLNRAADADVASLLGDWLATRHWSQLDRHSADSELCRGVLELEPGRRLPREG
ncbi:hypothetical protein PR202_ga08589 [Eleusine coracana subsp. coracana]|uniref:Exocyst subunit Exo70 family protein n=1 Tax=Eleusine coracana subsp. coracana TaxID=191504 RepID=A0AAV5C3P1_ELECO|nr:hypothetical protein PR202_ga08589 [Eleusine coracana subsp. coracana]